MKAITIIGAGLAGTEAAWQAAQAGCRVLLFEMRPRKKTPAHQTDGFAELICSNSFRAANVENAVGLLKAEMRLLDSLIMKAADATRVPAGGALAVDRQAFSDYVTKAIVDHPLIEVVYEEVTSIPAERPLVIASGPLTSDSLAQEIQNLLGEDYFYFYDAVAPIVIKESIDFSIIFSASRYGKGSDDYLNAPMNKAEYEAFYNAVIEARVHEAKSFEKEIFFEGCMPIEEMAKRGKDTMRFGPMKPVGLIDPRTGKEPYAVVQLRQDNAAASLYNIVGFQTHLAWPDQKKILKMIPGLAEAEFARLGVMHRNTYIHSPQILEPTLEMSKEKGVFFAGQMTGVEGYVESAASGIAAGRNAARLLKEERLLVFPKETALGSLTNYITHNALAKFQPMNITFGLMPPLEVKVRKKKEKNALIAKRALEKIKLFGDEVLLKERRENEGDNNNCGEER